MISQPLAVAAIVSDTHCGSSIGLCPPVVQLDDGGEYRHSKRAQTWLWDSWMDFVARAKHAAGESPLVTIINGDLVDGDHHSTTAVINENPAIQMRVAVNALSPLVESSSKVYVIRGTEAHVGQSAWAEELYAEKIDAFPDINSGNKSWWVADLDFHGVTINIAHHGSLGRLPWTRPNAVNRIASELIINYAESGCKPPRLAIRSHMHQYADSADNYRSTRVIATPAWQLKTPFTHKIAPSSLSDIGGLLVYFYGSGEFVVESVRYYPSRGEPSEVFK